LSLIRRYKNLSKASFLGFSFVHLAHRRDTHCASGQGRVRTQDLGIPREAQQHYPSFKNLKYANFAADGHVITSSSTFSFRFLPSQDGMSFESTTVDKSYPGSFDNLSGVCSPPFHPPFLFLGNVSVCFYLSFSQRRISVSHSTFAEWSK
jgi:hypothetical protein